MTVEAEIRAVEDCYIDNDTFNNTVRITCVGFAPLRQDMFRMMCNFGLAENDGLTGLYQKQKTSEYFAVFENEDGFDKFSEMGQVAFKGRVFTFCAISKEIVTLRIHWLPMYIKNEYLVRVFEKFGTVNAVKMEQTLVNGSVELYTGVRTVILECDEWAKHSIPHLIKTTDGLNMLITTAGRLPLCLKCKCLGHLRKDCNGNQRRSYAQAAGPPTRPPPVVGTREVTKVVNTDTDVPAPEVEDAPPSDHDEEMVEDNPMKACTDTEDAVQPEPKRHKTGDEDIQVIPETQNSEGTIIPETQFTPETQNSEGTIIPETQFTPETQDSEGTIIPETPYTIDEDSPNDLVIDHPLGVGMDKSEDT